jgi:fructose-1,6-bisphosphatase/inositol monophosphatase family enzyme
MGGLLICQEAGAVVREVYGRDMVVTAPGERRALVAAGTEALATKLLAERAGRKLS